MLQQQNLLYKLYLYKLSRQNHIKIIIKLILPDTLFTNGIYHFELLFLNTDF